MEQQEFIKGEKVKVVVEVVSQPRGRLYTEVKSENCDTTWHVMTSKLSRILNNVPKERFCFKPKNKICGYKYKDKDTCLNVRKCEWAR